MNKHQEGTSGHTTRDCQGGGWPTTNSERRNGRTGIQECCSEGGGWVRDAGHSNRGRASYRARSGSLVRRYAVDGEEFGRDGMGGIVGVVHGGQVIVISSWNIVKVDVQSSERCGNCGTLEKYMLPATQDWGGGPRGRLTLETFAQSSSHTVWLVLRWC